MREILNLNKELEFNNNIAEITSISLECDYEVENNKAIGNFLIEGTFRSHEISLNQAEFNFKIPFEYNYKKEIVPNSGIVDVKDFTYTINSNILCVDIEYEVQADEMIMEDDFLDREEFDRFLTEHEVEVVNFTCNDLPEENVKETILPELDHLEDEPNINIIPIEDKEMDRDLATSLIDNVSGSDTYITYHVYICTENDSLESISNKFKISIDTLKNYNAIDNINIGMKLIIPTDE